MGMLRVVRCCLGRDVDGVAAVCFSPEQSYMPYA